MIRFPVGYSARLEVAFETDEPVGRVEAWFFHELDPTAPPLPFVEDEEAREKGSRTGAVLTCYLMEGTDLGGSRDGEEVVMSDAPPLRFVVTDRDGSVPDPPAAPRVTGLGWA